MSEKKKKKNFLLQDLSQEDFHRVSYHVSNMRISQQAADVLSSWLTDSKAIIMLRAGQNNKT